MCIHPSLLQLICHLSCLAQLLGLVELFRDLFIQSSDLWGHDDWEVLPCTVESGITTQDLVHPLLLSPSCI